MTVIGPHSASAAGPRMEVPPLGPHAPGLSGRLNALARLIQIGSARSDGDGFSRKLLDDAEELLSRCGQRLRMSANHTVVALAGGTGSGKSSLFNRMAGAEFSPVGVTRPVTRDAHACVWGVTGSGPLLDWLGVPRRYRYARASALDRGEDTMTGLLLLDLPDHDSVVAGASGQVDRLVGLSDLMIWVLDPQKYADAAVHRRYLVPLAGHAEVIAVVLNQSDLLTPPQIEDCVADLRRLLDGEGLTDVQILVTSAITGAGLDELRKLLISAVSDRRTAVARISADLDGMVARFEPYAIPPAPEQAKPFPAAPRPTANGATATAGTAEAGQPADAMQDAIAAPVAAPGSPAAHTGDLVEAFSEAAGVPAVGDALQSARELRAMDYVGWPVAWLAERVSGRDPVRKVRLGKLWDELRSVTAGPSGAQRPEIDNALTKVADEVGPPLPKPWSQTIRSAVRSRANEIPGALGGAIGESLPAENKAAGWWRLVGAWQGLLLGSAIVGLAWLVLLLIFGVFKAAGNMPRLFSDAALIPWVVLMIGAILLIGWLTARACMNVVRTAALREQERIDADIRSRIAVVASEMVVMPADQELSELERYREELAVAAGQADRPTDSRSATGP